MALSRVNRILNHLSKSREIARPSIQHLSGATSVLSTRKSVKILDSSISYLDTGNVQQNKNTVVFLHGNPTAAYLWRNIIPHVQDQARCLAPDLIGMGHSGKNPTGSYTYFDHYRYLSEWFEAIGIGISDKVTIVCHDWGSGLGLHWCHMNQDQVNAIVHMESMVSTVPSWDMFPELAAKFFQALRSPTGEEMVIKNNLFVERLLPGSIIRELTKEEMDEYRKPYVSEGESRRPTLTWPREIPVERQPKDVHETVTAYSTWLRQTQIPKLYIHADPGFFSPAIKKTALKFPNTTMVTVKGLHFLQEDSPDEIGKAISKFLETI